MTESLLPPVTAILRANISEFRAGMAAAKTEMATVEGSAAKMNAGISRAGKGSALAIAGVAAYSVHLAANFEQATNVLVTAAGETESGLKVVRDGIKQVGLQTGVSFGQLESGSYVLEKAGYRGANAVQLLRVASQGAREENADLGTVINAMTSVMASYHLKTSDSVRVMNALKTGAGEAKTSMEDYAGALSTVLPIASAAHISFADVAGDFATLTQHGTSAQESTQELAATIRALQAPLHPAQTAMQQLGLSVNDVSQNLGKRGLTGTLDLLSQAILQHMGPSGLVLMSAFNQSKTAAQNASIMIGNMPPNLQKLAVAYRDGTISMTDWRKEIRGNLDPAQANLLRQYATLENRARGFSDQIKSGSPAAQTYTSVLKQVTGGAIGLNTALQLTGENMAVTKEKTGAVAEAMRHGGKDIDQWDKTLRNANTAMGQARDALEIVAMGIGNTLIPAVRSSSEFVAHHTTTVKILASALGVVLVAATGAWVTKLAWGAGKATVSFLQIIARIGATQVSYAGLTRAATAADVAMAGTAKAEAAIAASAPAAVAGMSAETAAASRLAGTMGVLRGALMGVATAGVFAADAFLVPTALKGLSNLPKDFRGLGLNGKVKSLYGDYYKNASPQLRGILDAHRGDIMAGLAATQKQSLMDKLTGNVHTGKLQDALKKLLAALANPGADPRLHTPGFIGPTIAESLGPNFVGPLSALERGIIRHPRHHRSAADSVTAQIARLLHENTPYAGPGGGTFSGLGSGSGAHSGRGRHRKVDPLAGRRNALRDLVESEILLGHREAEDSRAAKAGHLSEARAAQDRTAAVLLVRRAKALEESTRGTKLHLKAVSELVRAENELTTASRLLATAHKQRAKGKGVTGSQAHPIRLEAPTVNGSDPCALGNIKSLLALTNPGGAAAMAMLQASFSVDGQKLFEALQPHALRYQNRNATSGVVAPGT